MLSIILRDEEALARNITELKICHLRHMPMTGRSRNWRYKSWKPTRYCQMALLQVGYAVFISIIFMSVFSSQCSSTILTIAFASFSFRRHIWIREYHHACQGPSTEIRRKGDTPITLERYCRDSEKWNGEFMITCISLHSMRYRTTHMTTGPT